MQDLLRIFESLISKPKQAMKLIERIARLQRLGPAETKAVLDLCSWEEDHFRELMTVLEKFECYETADVKEKAKSTIHVSQVKMSKGEVLTMTNQLLVRLSKVPGDYFINVSGQIKASSISLKSAVLNFEKDQARWKVVKQMEAATGNNMDKLRELYPGHFKMATIDAFLGATVSNHRGAQLRDYMASVVAGGSSIENDVKLEQSKPLEDLVAASDILVVRCKVKNSDFRQEDWLDKVCRKDLKTVLLFGSEEEQLNALSYLRTKDDFKTKQLFFDKEVAQGEEENLQLCLLTGQVEVGPKLYCGKLDNLSKVVSELSKPGSKVSSIADPGLELLLVHSEESTGCITYNGSHDQLAKVKIKMEKEGSRCYKEVDVMDVDKTAAEEKSGSDGHSEEKVGTELIEEYDTNIFNGSNKFKCTDCHEQFINEPALKAHFSSMHSDYQCVQCGEAFTSKEGITIHKENVHGGKFQGLAKTTSETEKGSESQLSQSVDLMAAFGGGGF